MLKSMCNLMDYLAWRGDLPLSRTPWCDADALVMATLSYLNFDQPEGKTLSALLENGGPLEAPGKSYVKRKALFEAASASLRFSSCVWHHFLAMTEEEIDAQFAAVCMDLPDGTMCVAFRGTDNTLVGWREDFNMSFQSSVPAQEAAAIYLENALACTNRPVRVVGHSKGGNLAMYAAAVLPEEKRHRLLGLWSFDGPGLTEELFMTPACQSLMPVVRHFVPQTAIIGLLMSHPVSYTVVRAEEDGIRQHDPFTWQIYGPAFVTEPRVDKTAALLEETFHEWMKKTTPLQRGVFVEMLFRMLEKTGAETMSEILSEKMKSTFSMLLATREIDPETRRIFTRLASRLFSLGVENVVERVSGRGS